MSSLPACWLLLEKSDATRISKGIDGYQDMTGESYDYDSLVPNHKNLSPGDTIVLRKEDQVLGLGTIAGIEVWDSIKTHRRCPACRSTDIRERSEKSPKWKCGKCAGTFTDPDQTQAAVRAYRATIQNFDRFAAPPSVTAVKACAAAGNGPASQLSILALDLEKLITLLEGRGLMVSRQIAPSNGQGFGLSQAERKAVELLAMQRARQLYEGMGWAVIDTSMSHPFDLLATKDEARRFIEVKGTTGLGEAIQLTCGEVAHMMRHPQEAVLVVIANVQLAFSDGEWLASAGTLHAHHDPWVIDEALLRAIQYRYVLPAPGPSSADTA